MDDHDVNERLDAVMELSAIFQAAIDGQTEILRTQTEMLTALLREATKDPGPSAAVQAIGRLSALMTARLDACRLRSKRWHRQPLAAE
jgi:hypothetical protein